MRVRRLVEPPSPLLLVPKLSSPLTRSVIISVRPLLLVSCCAVLTSVCYRCYSRLCRRLFPHQLESRLLSVVDFDLRRFRQLYHVSRSPTRRRMTADAYDRSPVSSRPVTEFSPCSIGNICTALGSSLNTRCLGTPGAAGNPALISLRSCGNGILEAGEDCDPGNVDDPCCNRVRPFISTPMRCADALR